MQMVSKELGMSTVQILLAKDLLIHLAADVQVTLKSGLQEVEQEIADHWYVKAHSQPVTAAAVKEDEYKKQLEATQAELASVSEQLTEAETTIADLQKQLADATTTKAK